MRAVLEQELALRLADLDVGVKAEQAELRRRQSELRVRSRQLVNSIDYGEDHVLSEADARLVAAAEAHRSSDPEGSDAVGVQRRLRSEHAALVAIRRRKGRLREELHDVELQLAAIEADLQSLLLQAEARARQLSEAFRRDLAVYEQSLLRAHPQGELLRPLLSKDGPEPTRGVPVGPPPAPSAGDAPPVAWWKRLVPYVILTLLAGANAVWIARPLIDLIGRDPVLVVAFAVAMSGGTVATAHEVGRVLKSRATGFGGGTFWIATLCALGVAIGILVTWLQFRIQVPARPDAPTGTQLQLALLAGATFVLTGALATTVGYRFSDPRSAELRAALTQREKIAREAAEQQYKRQLATTGPPHPHEARTHEPAAQAAERRPGTEAPILRRPAEEPLPSPSNTEP